MEKCIRHQPSFGYESGSKPEEEEEAASGYVFDDSRVVFHHFSVGTWGS